MVKAKRASLFNPSGSKMEDAAPPPAPVPVAEAPPANASPENTSRKYPVAKTREGKRVATVYLDKEALRQLQRIALDEETTLQALLVEGINAIFAVRGLSRIA
jgi:hypothetical protein